MAQLSEVEDVLLRIRGEYLEMPGLRLTLAQARRLWGLDVVSCESVLNALIDAKFLRRARDGTFVRFDSDTPAGDHGKGFTARGQRSSRPVTASPAWLMISGESSFRKADGPALGTPATRHHPG